MLGVTVREGLYGNSWRSVTLLPPTFSISKFTHFLHFGIFFPGFFTLSIHSPVLSQAAIARKFTTIGYCQSRGFQKVAVKLKMYFYISLAECSFDTTALDKDTPHFTISSHFSQMHKCSVFCVFHRINCFNALSTQCPFGGYKMSGNGRELWVWLGCLPTEYTQINHSITNTDFLFWEPTFQNCLTSHKSLSNRILQYLCSKGF